jgi:RNA polymerase-binding transcription factor
MAKKVAAPMKKPATPAKKSSAKTAVPTTKKPAPSAAKKSTTVRTTQAPAKKAPASAAKKAPAKPVAKAAVKKSPPKQAVKPTAPIRTVKQPPQTATKTVKKTDTKTVRKVENRTQNKTERKVVAKADSKVETKIVKTASPVKQAAPPRAADGAAVRKVAAAATITKKAPAKKVAAAPAPAPVVTLAPVRGETKEGIKYTKDFDAKFLASQMKLLIEARESLTGQAVRLEDEANSLIDDEMGDVQFDDESGEGDTMVVERERDLFLSARARQDIEEIDAALDRLKSGTYGYSVISLRPIPRERLEAIPWATELTEEKVGGIGKR